jgi:hypothetical protein
MRVVQFKNRDKRVQALEVFLRTGGTIEGRPNGVFIVSWRHYAELVKAGLLKPPQVQQESRRAAKKTKTRSEKNGTPASG